MSPNARFCIKVYLPHESKLRIKSAAAREFLDVQSWCRRELLRASDGVSIEIPDKHTARMRFLAAVKSGRLKRPNTCPSCWRKVQVDGHHTDYSKPLDVIWLCRQCHNAAHKTARSK